MLADSIYENSEKCNSYARCRRKYCAANRLFVEGIMDIKKKTMALDANSTLRLTYGNVGSYVPRDAVFIITTRPSTALCKRRPQ